MSRPRSFDWDEAARLRGDGLSYAEIGRRLNVSSSAVVQAVDPKRRAQMQKTSSEWQRKHGNPGSYDTCACGQRKRTVSIRCQACMIAETIRPDALHCGSCGKWKPDEAFSPTGQTARRGRHTDCRECGTARRRRWRLENRERQQAYDRERYERRKALAE